MSSPLDLPGIAAPLARNILRLRQERGLSLSGLAHAAGISKGTLSEVERSRGNPSIETLWAIAEALGVPLSHLFADDAPSAGAHVVRQRDAPVLVWDEGFIGQHLLTRPGAGGVEFFVLSLAAGRRRSSEPHGDDVVEYVVALEGSVEIGAGDERHVLEAGDLIVFPADRAHYYEATAAGPARCFVAHEYGAA